VSPRADAEPDGCRGGTLVGGAHQDRMRRCLRLPSSSDDRRPLHLSTGRSTGLKGVGYAGGSERGLERSRPPLPGDPAELCDELTLRRRPLQECRRSMARWPRRACWRPGLRLSPTCSSRRWSAVRCGSGPSCSPHTCRVVRARLDAAFVTHGRRQSPSWSARACPGVVLCRRFFLCGRAMAPVLTWAAFGLRPAPVLAGNPTSRGAGAVLTSASPTR